MYTAVNTKWLLGTLLVTIVGLGACQSKRSTTGGQSVPSGDNSQTSIDWAGTYQGVLPCADCPGIKTAISLKDDGTYKLSTRYLEKGDSVYWESGTFSWNDAGSQITLSEDNRKFLVGENRLFQLDMEGNRITGDLAEHYVLQKAEETITGKYWKLVELSGKPVKPGSTQKEPFIRLTEQESRLEGTGGCNGMGGTYELQDPNRIRFSQIIRTQMACEGLEIENELIHALESADSYHLQNDSLQLFRARMAPMAKFEAVYVN
ncbi:copper resistance protein NlpE N-terminal domain-containing protein [Parapedobacter tibetensis]|uniref:copper resistance protein NlpE N-terminal domain-containing protein n=1 Tax=Parapedobacter tibetensis TaxID=2972951 RepID=UPI00214DBFC7|nr:copper resistance protein NlpE N-terminal domain-containing protein [Parapedobacter tibetensis]